VNTRDRWRRLQTWFHRLDELDPVARTEELDRLAVDEPDLQPSLLRLFAEEDGVLAEELALEGLAVSAFEEEVPEQIGPYRLLRVLGKGGMGTVYEADQVEHVSRKVALKLMRVGLDSQRVVARFHLERQSLAVMDHPNIARVLDAGTTETGRPYFVMELVDGEPITRWANRHQLSLEARIELFLPVCRAVQHAHTKGIIHRDLKPNNILVTEVEGKATPKVIDFGIAKAIEQPAIVRTLATQLGEIVGTPAYMSPEQATLGRVDVDTRSDVYGLGIVLYELLVGELPLADGEVANLLFDEICRRIREDETPRPSVRISHLGTVPGSVAPVDTWKRRLRGDLDQVILKALAKSRDRRYESVAAFAADLERFLANLPVEATPPSLTYRASKLIRRHRSAVVTTIVTSLLVLAGLVVAAINWRDARRSEVESRSALATAQRTTSFLVELFRDVAPSEQPGIQVSARELLDRGAVNLDRGFEDDPAVRGSLLHTLGQVYGNLPDYARSEELLQEALEVRLAMPRPDPLEVASTQAALGEILGIRERFDEAEALLGEAVETRRSRLGESSETAEALEDLGSVYASRGDVEGALALLEEALGMRRQLGDPLPLAESLRLLGTVRNSDGQRDKALEVLQESLEIYRLRGAESTLAATNTLLALATALLHQGDMERAESLFRQAAETRRLLAGESSHSYAWSVSMLAWSLRRQGKLEEAERWMREGLEVQRRLLGEENSEVGEILGNLGRIVEQRGGDPGEIEGLYQQSLKTLEATLGANNSSTVEALVRLSRYRKAQGKLQESEELAREVLRRLDAAGTKPGSTLWYREALLGDVLAAQGRFDESEALLRPAWENLLRNDGATAPSTASATRMLAEMYRQSGRPEEATRVEDSSE
jgi:non-specific serine/threonine protein kinase/serine/threonine-protein kinase